jgi:hypothetical protein
MPHSSILAFFLSILSFVFVAPAPAAEQPLKPYLLGYRGAGTISEAPAVSRSRTEGLPSCREYVPYHGALVLVATSEALKAAAAKSGFGAYGAVVRVSLTSTGPELQVAATNPRYFAAAYRMKDGLEDAASALEQAIGKTAEFGSQEGMTAAKLRKYHYMMMMPYFDEPVKLATFPSHDEALAAVETGLAAKRGGTSKVYRVDVPGRKESVIGVAIGEGEGEDGAIMKIIDIGELKQIPHLPYELVVFDGAVYMLHGKFRIALDFPDLTMGTFMKISGAPSAIEEKLRGVTGAK